PSPTAHRPTPPIFPYTTLFRSAGEITEQLAEERADDETGHDDQHDEAEPTLGRRAGGDVYATISGLASVTTRVSAAIARRRCLGDRKSTRLNSSHQIISYAVFC